MRCSDPASLDDAIGEMIAVDRPVIFDCAVDQTENCFPMIPSGKAHNEMILNEFSGDEESSQDIGNLISAEGKMLV